MPILPMSCRRAACPMSAASSASRPSSTRDQLARAPDPVRVLARCVVTVLGRQRQPVEHLELGVLELPRAQRDALVQQVVVLLQLDAEVAGLQEVAHAQQHLGHVDRLRQEVTRAQRQRAALGVRCDIGSQHEHGHPVRLLGEERDVLEDLGAAAPGMCQSSSSRSGGSWEQRASTAMGSLMVSTAV